MSMAPDSRALTTGIFNDWHPNWGTRGILFSSNRGTNPDERRIWSIQPDGSRLRKVGDIGEVIRFWLPDGRIVLSDAGITSRHCRTSIFDPATGHSGWSLMCRVI